MNMTITATPTPANERPIRAGRRLMPAAGRNLLGSRRALWEIPVR
jgi:hypothetical protein